LSNNNYIYCRIQQGLKYSSKLKIKYSSDYNQKVVIFWSMFYETDSRRQ